MLGDNRIHRVYVCEGGKVKGIITPTDILRWVAAGEVPALPTAVSPEGLSNSSQPVEVA